MRWLLNKEKALPRPNLYFEDIDSCSGYYLSPLTKFITINNNEYENKNGSIVIASEFIDGSYESTLVHEFRHHWQFYNGLTFDQDFSVFQRKPYDEALVDYFTKSYTEFDALRYQVKMCKNDFFVEYTLSLLNNKAFNLIKNH